MPLEPRQDRQDAQDQLPSAPLQDQGHGTQAGFGRRMSGGAGGRSMTVKPFIVALALVAGASVAAHAQQASPSNTAAATMPSAASIPITDYVIGPEDMLQITVWKNESLSRALPVRPDGKISLPL